MRIVQNNIDRLYIPWYQILNALHMHYSIDVTSVLSSETKHALLRMLLKNSHVLCIEGRHRLNKCWLAWVAIHLESFNAVLSSSIADELGFTLSLMFASLSGIWCPYSPLFEIMPTALPRARGMIRNIYCVVGKHMVRTQCLSIDKVLLPLSKSMVAPRKERSRFAQRLVSTLIRASASISRPNAWHTDQLSFQPGRAENSSQEMISRFANVNSIRRTR